MRSSLRTSVPVTEFIKRAGAATGPEGPGPRGVPILSYFRKIRMARWIWVSMASTRL